MADEVDQKSLTTAKQQAQKTGVPQPVKSKSGRVLYYVDYQGAVVPTEIALDARKRANPTKGADALNSKGGLSTPQERQLGERSKPPVTASSLGQQQMWIDGQLVWVEQNDDGTWITRTAGKPDGEGATLVPPSAFDALDGKEIDRTSPFLMGYKVGGTKAPAAQNDVQAAGNASGARQSINKNMMTIDRATSWLAALSTKDNAAYQAMIEKLYNAGYLSEADKVAAAGHWSSAVGTAFAYAARDTAVINNTKGGEGTTLDQFLASKQGARASAEEASKPKYEPVQRNYTDPEDIRAASKSAAEAVLGRQLTDEEEAKLTGHFRALEDGAYDQIDAAAGAGGARVTMPGSGQIDAFVEGPEHEQEAAAYRAAEYGQALKRLFGVATGG